MKKLLLRKFTAFFCLLLPILLSTQPLFACSWDYPIWQIRNKNADPLYRFVQGGKFGFIDQKGKVVVKPTLKHFDYNGGYEFFNGLLYILFSEGKYIDKEGNVLSGDKYNNYSNFSEGLALSKNENNNKWGYIDKFDMFVIEPKFFEVNNFSEGLARVVAEGSCNFMGDDACAEDNIHLVGEEIDGETNYPMCKFTFVDKKGNTITNQRFERAMDFSEGLAAIQIDRNWGFINKQGQIVISPQFEDVDSFSDGLALFKQGKLRGFIDKQGNVVIPPKFEAAHKFADGLAPVGKLNRKNHEWENYVFINKDGKQAFKGEYQLASHFFKGLAHVKLLEKNKPKDASYWEGKYAYINTNGKFVFEYEARDEDDD